jgi:glycosyltransferase involved in cell wall biosynthesis
MHSVATASEPVAARAAADALGQAAGTALVHVFTVPCSFLFLAGQASFMREAGFAVHAVASPGPEHRQFAAREGAETHSVPMTRTITPLRDLVSLWRLCDLLRALRPRIVHSHTPKGGLLGMIAASLSRTPVRIYTIHGLPLLTCRGWKRSLMRWTERVSCSLAHRVLAVSRSIRDVAVEEGICPGDKIAVLLEGSVNGVDAGHFKPHGAEARRATRARLGIPDDAEVVGFAGRLVRDKGLVELAEAWSRLRELRQGAHLLVVGREEPQDPVPAHVLAGLRADPRVHMAGHARAPEMPGLYAAMDVVALPTHREGFGIVAIEAGAMELPIVATRIPGCVDAVVDGVTGVLVPAGDAGALCTALERYLKDPELRARHGSAGRARVLTSFQQPALWTALAREYSALLRKYSPASETDPS